MAEDSDYPWSDEADQFIGNIDEQISHTYGIELRQLLLSPDGFANTTDIMLKIDNIKAAVDDYFTGIRDSFKEEQMEFEKSLTSADAQYNKIEGVVSTKASLSRVPYIKTGTINVDATLREEIGIDGYDNDVDALIGKLVNISNYIADISTRYKKYYLGSWLFSGQRAYVLSINQPDSPMIMVERVNTEIDDMLDSVKARMQLMKK